MFLFGTRAYVTIEVKNAYAEQERSSMSNFESFMVSNWEMKWK